MSLAKSRLFVAAIVWCMVLGATGCASPAATPISPYTLKPQADPYVREEPIEYYLFLPSHYAPERAWPLFVGLHGYGGSARDCLSDWQAPAEQEGFVLVCPSLNDPYGGWEQDVMKKTLHEVIGRVQTEVHVQPRAFVAGFSAGGHLTQRFAWAYHDSVAAVAVLSAVTYDEPEAQAKAIPFLITLGDGDHLGGVKQVQQFQQDLQQAGFKAELHILPGVGHNITREVLDLTMDFFKRALSH